MDYFQKCQKSEVVMTPSHKKQWQKQDFKSFFFLNNYLKTLERVQKQAQAEGKFNLKKLPQEGVRIESLCLPALKVMPNSYSYSYLKNTAMENHSLTS